jgi:DMSO/TMAO reductase YedYZ molybdopterin-dependent catalytic subunit
LVLGMLGLGAIGIVAGSRIQNGLSDLITPLTKYDPTGLSSLLPFGGWQIYNVTNSLPQETDGQWRLRIDGLVDRPLVLGYQELKAMESVHLLRDFQCVTGWRVENVPWVGVRLSTILDKVGVQPKAKALSFGSFDGVYTESLTLAQARLPDVVVAYEMLNAPVTREHGGPVRLYVAPMYGYKSCKWLNRITITDEVIPGFWEVRGYDVNAWVGDSNGRSDQPTN